MSQTDVGRARSVGVGFTLRALRGQSGVCVCDEIGRR